MVVVEIYLCQCFLLIFLKLTNQLVFIQRAAELYYEKLRLDIKTDLFKVFQNKGLESQAQLFRRAIEDEFTECSDFGLIASGDDCVYPIWLNKKQKLESDLRSYLIEVSRMCNFTLIQYLLG